MIDQSQALKRLKALLILLAILAPIIYGLFWFFTHGNLTINLPGDNKDYSVQVINPDSGKQVASTVTRDNQYKVRLKSGNYEVRLSTDFDKKASSYTAKVPRLLGNIDITSQIDNQFARSKVGKNTSACPVYTGSELYSYSCAGSIDSFFLHTKIRGGNYSSKSLVASLEETQVVGAEPYNNKLLVMVRYEDSPSPVMLLINNGAIEKSLTLPSSFVSSDDTYILRTDRANSEKFAVARDQGAEILSYQNLSSSPQKITFDPKKYNDRSMGFSIDLINNSLLTAYGHTSFAPDSEAESEAKNSDSGGEAYVYSLDQNSLSDIKPHKLDGYIDKVGFCQSGYICQLDEEKLHIFSITDSKRVASLKSVSDFASIGGKQLCYLQNGRIYATDTQTNTIKLAYSSNNFSVSGVYSSPGGILMIALLNNSGIKSEPHAFIVNPNPSTTNSFIDDVLPYKTGDFGFIRDFDYQGNNIVATIQVARSVAFMNGKRGAAEYDTKEYAQKRSRLMNELKKDGIDPSDYNISTVPFSL